MKKFSRRDFIKRGVGTTLLVPVTNVLLNKVDSKSLSLDSNPLLIDVSADLPPLLKNHLKMGTSQSPDGQIITADSRSLLFNDKPWSPVMGEFHFARYPETEWRDELLKIKMGGVSLLATYVFWIHHEEVEGEFDWTGRRNLRRFIELCKEVGLYSAVRCGPWCHGEVRNGGLPDWLLKRGVKIRSDDASYLEKVKEFYGEIANQLKGLFWKDGGTIIAIQFENEYRGAAEHLLNLKRIGREAGFDAPLYTRTGWPQLRTKMPVGEMLPLFGSYADGFWDRAITKMPGRYGDAFLFKLARNDAEVATDQLGKRIESDGDDVGNYPYLCCEIGGGMERSYHRRIKIFPEDILSASMIKLGSGNNMQGYYMYHGGTNPEGKLTSLQESQATKYWNDVPVKSYDFQAPLGEFGQINKHYHLLRLTHLFLRDFGSSLATIPAYLPEKKTDKPDDTKTLRWSARSDGASGYIFVNNYHRLQTMPPKESVQFELKLKNGNLRIPSAPFTVPANSVFFIPFNLEINGIKLIYATAQPICSLEEQGTTYMVFAQIKDVPTEFLFDRKNVIIEGTLGINSQDTVFFSRVKASTNPVIRLRTIQGKRLAIILLDENQSLACWKGMFEGLERIFLTNAGLILDGNQIRLSSDSPSNLQISIFPAPTFKGSKINAVSDGLFKRFIATKPKAMKEKVMFEQIQNAALPREIKKGGQGVAEAPTDEDFSRAAVWRLKLPEKIDYSRNLLLRVNYVGDVARVYLDGKLLTDNFYNGNSFEIGLKRYAPDIYRKELLLKILPLRKDAPIYLQDEAKPNFGNDESIAKLNGIDVIEQCEVTLGTRYASPQMSA